MSVKKQNETITVDYSDGNIIINNKSVFNIDKIRDITTGEFINNNNNNKTIEQNVKIQQQMLNYLDSIKDGANVTILRQLELYPLADTYGNYPTFDKDLHEYENNVKHAVKSSINKITWTKIKKKSQLNPPLKIDYIFRDCGIGPDVFIAPKYNLINNLANYIDPATRGEPTEAWPSNGNSITFSNNFMDLFGLPKSRIDTKTMSKDKFKYNIISNGQDLSYNGFGQDPNLQFFAGNTNKNKILKDSRNDQAYKKALIYLKEWGDKTQVLFLFIWSMLNKGKTYTLITCDKVVYTLSLLLGVKCIMTGQVRENNERKYCIEIFEPSDDPLGDTINRFDTTQKSIIEENNSYLQMITLLKDNPGQPIYIDGVDTPIIYNKKFYTNIYNDISAIQTKLESFNINNIISSNVEKQQKISNIEDSIKTLKEEYLLILVIRKIKNKIKITRINKYTASIKYKPSFNNSPKALFELGKQYIAQQNGGSRQKQLGYPKVIKASRQTKPQSTIKSKNVSNIPSVVEDEDFTNRQSVVEDEDFPNIPSVFGNKVFSDSDFYFSPISSLIKVEVPIERESNPNDQVFDTIQETYNEDINDVLYLSIMENLYNNSYAIYVDSIYTMILTYAYINNGISFDNECDDLKNIIAKIIQNDLKLDNITPIKHPPMDVQIDNGHPQLAQWHPTAHTGTQQMIVASGGSKKIEPKNLKKTHKNKKNKKNKKTKKHINT